MQSICRERAELQIRQTFRLSVLFPTDKLCHMKGTITNFMPIFKSRYKLGRLIALTSRQLAVSTLALAQDSIFTYIYMYICMCVCI